MSEIDEDGDRADEHVLSRAAENSIVADGIEAMKVFKQFVMDQWRQCQRNGRSSLNLARSHVFGS